MSTVYLAERSDGELQQRVAIKLVCAGHRPGWQGRCAANEPFAAGAQAIVMVRPEDIELGRAEASADGMLVSGRLANSIFRGARRSLIVETGSQRLNIEIPASQPIPADGAITMAVKPGAAWAIRP